MPFKPNYKQIVPLVVKPTQYFAVAAGGSPSATDLATRLADATVAEPRPGIRRRPLAQRALSLHALELVTEALTLLACATGDLYAAVGTDEAKDAPCVSLLTRWSGVSMIETALSVYPGLMDQVGGVTDVLSHAWCDPDGIPGLVAAVQATLEREDGGGGGGTPSHAKRFWVDVFAVAQNTGSPEAKRNHVADTALVSFRTVFESMQRTVLHWSPPFQPLALERIWCLFELYHCMRLQLPIVLAVKPADLAAMAAPGGPAKLRLALEQLRTLGAKGSVGTEWEALHSIFEERLGKNDPKKPVLFLGQKFDKAKGKGAWTGAPAGHAKFDDMLRPALVESLRALELPVPPFAVSRFLRRLSGEIIGATVAACGPGRRLIATACTSVARVWEFDSESHKHKMGEHFGIITCVCALGDKAFCTGSGDGTVCVWGLQRGDLITRFYGHKHVIHDMVTLPVLDPTDNVPCLATTSHDSTQRIWDVDHSVCLRHMFSNDQTISTKICCAGEDLLVGCSYTDRSLRVWHWFDGTPHAVLVGHTGLVTNLASLPSVALHAVASASVNMEIKVWDCLAKVELRSFGGHLLPIRAMVSFRGLLATGSDDATIRVWDASTGEMTRLIQCPADEKLTTLALIGEGDDTRLLSSAKGGSAIAWRYWWEAEDEAPP